MGRIVGIIALALLALVALAAAAVVIGGARWRRETERALARLEAAGAPLPAPADDAIAARLRALPPPVARYFALVLPADPRPLAAARIEWAGELRMRPDAGWVPFTATQRFTASPPGFVWDARIRMMPVVPVRVRDSYIARDAAMLGRVGGVVAVVDQAGAPELAASALGRWLGEAVWFPAALLPPDLGGAVEWTPVNGSTARATVTDGAVSASAVFRFARTGEILGMRAMRFRDVGGVPELTVFEGSYGRYVRRGGVLVPEEAEVAWILPEGRFAYWRGRPAEVEYAGAP